MKQLLASVIVPAKNASETLEMCLKSIKAQTYSPIEVIVVDNFSTDETQEIAKKYATKILLKGPERSAQRNHGANYAKGEYLLFIDADMELTSKVVQECVSKASVDYDAAIIPELTIGEGFWAEVRAIERATYVGDTLFEAARFFKKKVFQELEGYDENMTGLEDYDIQARLEEKRYKIAHINALIIHHEGKVKLGEHLMKKYYYAGKSKKYFVKHSRRAKKQFTLIRRTYLKRWRLLMKDPLHAFGLVLMKGLELVVGVLALIIV
jgi:glycosyltransferase involved in cell wall biosynthesis